MLEKILLYNVKNPQHIIKATSNIRIICGFINKSDTDKDSGRNCNADVRGISLSDAERNISHKENKERVLLYSVT